MHFLSFPWPEMLSPSRVWHPRNVYATEMNPCLVTHDPVTSITYLGPRISKLYLKIALLVTAARTQVPFAGLEMYCHHYSFYIGYGSRLELTLISERRKGNLIFRKQILKAELWAAHEAVQPG